MKIENKGQFIQYLIEVLPYPEQVKNIDLEKNNCVYFEWRSCRYKAQLNPFDIMVSKMPILEGSDSAILMRKLFENRIVKDL